MIVSIMTNITLLGLNARYTHTSLALRYLYANLKEFQKDAKILEFSINESAFDIVEQILHDKPRIIAIGVYIWNALIVKDIIEIIKKILPKTKIVLGGPEVSHTPFRVDFSSADHIIQGEGEISFYNLCFDILHDSNPPKIINSIMPDLKELKLPYRYYSDHDIKHRYIYLEASRGCPYECEFCLSAIDERVRYFDIDKLLKEFETLWQRGARGFKFIDRTFNLNIKYATKLLDFFLSKDEPYSLHFEVIPDNFPPTLKNKIAHFPPATLQLEIGIQTLNQKILKNINRTMKLEKLKKNIEFLEKKSSAHLHLDLIIGLPGESLESFANNLNLLKSLTDSEIQIGLLKKLSGTTIDRHDEKHYMIYSDKPPYEILQNRYLSYQDIQDMKRFARFWDLTYNSGNFKQSIEYLFRDADVFKEFYNFSQWLYQKSQSTWKISLNRLSEFIFIYLTEVKNYDKTLIADTILEDIIRVNGRKIPSFLKEYASHIPDLRKITLAQFNKRQLLRV